MTRTSRSQKLAMLACVSYLLVASALSASEAESEARIDRVEVDRLVAAMGVETGYDVTKTTQYGRFQGSVYLRLARSIPPSEKSRTVLFIDHADWYHAYLAVTGLEADQAPVFERLSFENRQDVFIDPRPGRVVARVKKGPEPLLALSVRLSWPKEPGTAGSYSFEDLLTQPHVLVHNDRVVSFRLLDLGDQIVFDQVRGARVRPLTGALATLFHLIGLASVKQARMVVGGDGVTVARAHVKKFFFKVSATATVEPDGRAARGVPPQRQDLLALERRLKKPLDLDYERTDWKVFVAAAYATSAHEKEIADPSQ